MKGREHDTEQRNSHVVGAGLLALGLATAGPVWSEESPKSTGTGVFQGWLHVHETRGETPALLRAGMSTADRPPG